MAYVIGGQTTLQNTPDFWDYLAANGQQYQQMLMENLLGPALREMVKAKMDDYYNAMGQAPGSLNEYVNAIISGQMPTPPIVQEQTQPKESWVDKLKNFFGRQAGEVSPPVAKKPGLPAPPTEDVIQTFQRVGAQTTKDYVIAQTPEGRTYKLPLSNLTNDSIKELVRNGVTFPRDEFPAPQSTFSFTAQQGKQVANDKALQLKRKEKAKGKAKKAYEIAKKGLFGKATPNIM